jgi:hypothetical protein
MQKFLVGEKAWAKVGSGWVDMTIVGFHAKTKCYEVRVAGGSEELATDDENLTWIEEERLQLSPVRFRPIAMKTIRK